LTWLAILSGKLNFATGFARETLGSVEKTDQFPDDVGEYWPEHGEKPDHRHAAPGDLRNR
jgi:hypothetical protein